MDGRWKEKRKQSKVVDEKNMKRGKKAGLE